MMLGAGVTLVFVVIAGFVAAQFSGQKPPIGPNINTQNDVVGPVTPAIDAAVTGPRYLAATYADLAGWAADDLSEILVAWRRSCWSLLERPLDSPIGPSQFGVSNVGGNAADWAAICQSLAGLPDDDDTAVRHFIVENMTPVAVLDGVRAEGLFTGYYEPVLLGSRERTDEFTTPLYAPPRDRVRVDLGRFDPTLSGRQVVGKITDGGFIPYDTRGEIGAGSLDGRAQAIFWLTSPLDAFIMHVQGSARIDLPDGSQTRAGFAAHNGHAYASIGRWLIDQGEIEPHAASWSGIRAWMDANPSRVAALLAINPRYIFFTEIAGEGPIGAAGVPLTPRRSLAVDPTVIPLGIPVWLDVEPVGGNGDQIQRLMVAQDTGAAITGAVRGDFYWGSGDGAGRVAGQMSSRGRYYILLPNDVAGRLFALAASGEGGQGATARPGQ